MKKILYILRHAKAEVGSATLDDHERALNEQGVAACEVIGKYMADQAVNPGLVLCSTAKRAKETWALVKEASGLQAQQEYTDRLYLASANEMVGQLAQLPDSVASVMIVGHNPGLHQLCLALAKKGDEKSLDQLHMTFPTCAFAAIDLGETAWRDIALVDSALKTFVTPSLLSPLHSDD